MIEITATAERDAIEAARTLTRAANIIRDAPGLSDIEQTALIDSLCAMRDAVQVKKPAQEFVQYIAEGITEQLSNMGFKVDIKTTAAVNLNVKAKTPAQYIEIKVDFDETKL